MSITETPGATKAAGAAGAEYAGAVLHLARRYAANIPAGQRNEIDKAVWAALDRLPDARGTLSRLVRRAERLDDGRKRELFGGGYAFKPFATAVASADLEAIINGLGGTDHPADTKPVKHKYEVTFDHLVLDDVSNPEWLGKDESYVACAMITQAEANAGKEARGVHTPVYKLKEGERGPASGSQNLRLFGPAGPAPLDSDLLISLTAWEHDNEDLQGVVNDIATALTIAAGAAAALGKRLISVVLGITASIAGLVSAALADDQVGEPQSLVFTNADAETKTASSAQVTLPALRFDGGDPNGVVRVFLTLRRA